MSILNVNKINPVGSGSTVTIVGIASVTNNISVGNSVTASSFHGNLTGNLTGNTGNFTDSVGIGSVSPTGMIEVQKNGVPAIIANYNNSKHIQMGAGSNGAGFHLTTGNFFTVNHQPFTDRGTDNNLSEKLRIDSNGHTLPGADNTFDLGSTTKRWANIYSADLQLSNIGTGGNEVDGTEGKWTLQEAEDTVYMINRITGKRYKIKMEEV